MKTNVAENDFPEVVLTGCSHKQEEWNRLRKYSIGGSRIAAICGVNPYYTPLRVFMEMTGKIEPVLENDQMWLGTKLEPIVAELFERRTGQAVEYVDQLWKRADMPWAHCTPDYTYKLPDGTDGMLQIKTSGSFQKDKWKDGAAPDTALCQIHWEMGIGKIFQKGVVAGLLGGRADDFFHPEFEFSKDIFEQLAERALDFVENFVKKDIPPAATQAEDSKLVAKLYKVDNDRVWSPASEDDHKLAVSTLAEYMTYQKLTSSARKHMGEHDEVAKKAKAQLELMAQGAGSMLIAGKTVIIQQRSRKESVSKATSWTQLKIQGEEGAE